MTAPAATQTVTAEMVEEARAGLAAAVEAEDSAEVVVWHKVLSRFLLMQRTGCTWEQATQSPWC